MENSDAQYFEGEGNIDPISIFLEGKKIPFLDEMKIFLALDDLYKAIGGDSLQISNGEYLEKIVEPESEYEINQGTGFENQKTRLVSSLTTSHIQRKEVYATVRFLSKLEKTEEIIQILDQKFPEKVWEDNLPRIKTLLYLFNEQRDYFNIKGKI